MMEPVYKVMKRVAAPGRRVAVVDSSFTNLPEAIQQMEALRQKGLEIWIEPFYDGDFRRDERYLKILPASV